jgi:hypothetical protein
VGVKHAPAADSTLEALRSKARQLGRRIEIPERFSENTKVWANPDGRTLHAEVHTAPIQLQTADRKWQPIDTTIVRRDGALSPKLVRTPLEFGKAGSKKLVTANDADGLAAISSDRRLPEPVLTHNKIVYPNAIVAGADLVVTALPDGFIQSVVIRRRPDAPLSARLPLTLPNGMSYAVTADGKPQLRSAKGEPESPPLVVHAIDAAAEKAPDSGRIGVVSVKVSGASTSPILTLEPDPAFLADPAVTFPVTMSLSGVFVGAGMAADTFISKNNFTTSQLDATWLRVGTTSTSQDIARVFLRYYINGTDLDGARILNADLMLWNYRSGGPNNQNCGSQVGSGIVARKITTSWDPVELSWSDQPTWTTTGQAPNPSAYSDVGTNCSNGGELIHSVEQIVQAWAGGEPDYGFVLQAVTESPALNWRQYRSSEGGSWDRNMPDHAPILFIEYEPAIEEQIIARWDDEEPGEVTYEEALAH